MFKITFFNVGQGDAILLEWIDNNECLKIGIIDCNEIAFIDKKIERPNLRQPEDNQKILKKSIIVDYLKTYHPTLKTIDFILVTHKDHFSGIEYILEYCSDQKIKINYFFHTWSRILEYLAKVNHKDVEFSSKNEKFTTLLNKMHEYKSSGIIVKEQNIDNTWFTKLSNNIRLKFTQVSPTQKEYGVFSEKTKGWTNPNISSDDKSESNDDSKLMNSLSTIIEIFINNEHKIILTSDTSIESITEYLMADTQEYKSCLIQVPHHGSIKNHSKSLYTSVNAAEKKAIISVGKHYRYKHPSKEVIDDLINLGYKIFYTNYDYGLKASIPIKQESFEGDHSFIYEC
jgi:competence protein ComEC